MENGNDNFYLAFVIDRLNPEQLAKLNAKKSNIGSNNYRLGYAASLNGSGDVDVWWPLYEGLFLNGMGKRFAGGDDKIFSLGIKYSVVMEKAMKKNFILPSAELLSKYSVEL